MRNISQRTIRTIPIPLPDLAEQRGIAAKLKQSDREMGKLTSAIQRQIMELELMPPKLLAQVFESYAPR